MKQLQIHFSGSVFLGDLSNLQKQMVKTMFLGGKTSLSIFFWEERQTGKPLIFERYHEMIPQTLYTHHVFFQTHFPTKRTRYIAVRVTNDIAPIKAVDTKRPTWGPRVCQRNCGYQWMRYDDIRCWKFSICHLT